MEFTGNLGPKDYDAIFKEMYGLGTKEKCSVDSVIKGNDGDLNIESTARFICFFSEENVKDAYSFWKENYSKKGLRVAVTKGLAMFYPLSRPLLLEYFRREGMSDEGFYHGFDESKVVLKQIESIIGEIENKTKGQNLSEKLNELKSMNNALLKKIKDMKDEINQLAEEEENDAKYQKEKKELEAKIASLQMEKRNEDLKGKRIKYEEEKRKLEEDKKVETDRITKLKDEIANFNERYEGNTKFLRQLKGLLQELHPDREDE